MTKRRCNIYYAGLDELWRAVDGVCQEGVKKMYVCISSYVTYFEQRSASPDIEVELFMLLSEGLSVRINGERLVKTEKEIGSFWVDPNDENWVENRAGRTGVTR